jgi:FixJ family two-component response regulator
VRVRAALRAAGIRERQDSAPGAQHGWASLTRSEQGVVDLVAQGLTSREAAGEVFFSRITRKAQRQAPSNSLALRPA